MLYHNAEHALRRAVDFPSKSIPFHFIFGGLIKLKITCVRKPNNSFSYTIEDITGAFFLSLTVENACFISSV